MIKASSLEKGMYMLYKNSPHLVLEREFVKPGKGGAFVRLKLRAAIGGAVVRETLPSDSQIEEADVQKRPHQFLYREGAEWCFMDNENWEQQSFATSAMPSSARYLQEGENYTIISWQGEMIDIEIPPKVPLRVIETEDAVKGNTVGGATKRARLEGGAEVQLPLFIKNGDTVIVNTETGEYVERAST